MHWDADQCYDVLMEVVAPAANPGQLHSRVRDIAHHSLGWRLIATSLAIIGGFTLDIQTAAGITPEAIFWRVLWALTFIMGGTLCLYIPRTQAINIPILVGTGSAFFADRLLAVAGENATAHIGWSIAFPFAAAVLSPENPRAVVGTTIGFATAVFARELAWGQSVGAAWTWSFSVLLAGALAIYASFRYVAQKQELESVYEREADLGVKLALSEERRSEMQRVGRLQELAQLGEASAGIAHEINNPLTVIATNTDYLLSVLDEDENASEDAREAAMDIAKSVDLMNTLVMTVKASSRSKGEDDCGAHLKTVLEDALRMVHYRFGVTSDVKVEISAIPCHAKISPVRLLQIITNILANAFDALAAIEGERKIHVDTQHSPETITITVDDNGPGIPDEAVEHIFEPFFTTKSEIHGTGLGLALCRDYLREVGGDITVEPSTLGGCKFAITLPRQLN